VLRRGDDHYRPIGWDEAYRLIAAELRALASPNEAVFYTSGRTSNEAGIPVLAAVSAPSSGGRPCQPVRAHPGGLPTGRFDERLHASRSHPTMMTDRYVGLRVMLLPLE
jgi:hypothetical protein